MDNIEEIIDARTSDAIALALRFQAPIFTYKNILDKAGIYLKVNPKKEDQDEDSILMDELIAEEIESTAFGAVPLVLRIRRSSMRPPHRRPWPKMIFP